MKRKDPLEIRSMGLYKSRINLIPRDHKLRFDQLYRMTTISRVLNVNPTFTIDLEFT